MDVGVVRQEGDSLLHRPMHAAPAPFRKAVAPSREGLGVAVECLVPGRAPPTCVPNTTSLLSSVLPSLGKPSMAARRNTIRSLPTRLPLSCAAACSPRPLSLRPRGVPPVPCSDAVPPGGAHARRCDPTGTIPRATTPSPSAANSSPPQPTARGWPSAVRSPPCQKPWRSLWPSSPLMTPGARTWHSLSSQPPRTPRPTPCLSAPNASRPWQQPPPRAARRHPPERAVPTRTGVRFVLPPRPGSPGSGRQTPGNVRQEAAHAPLTGAFSAAAPLFWRHTPQGQTLLARVEKPPDTGTALRLLAPTRGRAVYSMLTRTVACESGALSPDRREQRGGARRPLDPAGRSLPPARWRCPLDGVCARHGVQRPCLPAPWRLLGPPAGFRRDGDGHTRGRGLPLPRSWDSLASPLRSARRLHRTVCGYGMISRAQRRPATRRCHRHARDEGPSNTCVVQRHRLAPEDRPHGRTPARLTPPPAMTRRKKTKTSALRSSVSLDKKRPHKCWRPLYAGVLTP